MCANAFIPGDFVIAYRISLLPFGIFKIEQKEKSLLWHLHNNSFKETMKNGPGETIRVTPVPFHVQSKDAGTQLNLF